MPSKFIFNPQETVKNFLHLCLNDKFNDRPNINVNIYGNEINLTVDGTLSSQELHQVSQMVSICEEALSNIPQ